MPNRCHITGLLYDAQAQVVMQGSLTARLQQDIISADGEKIVPITVTAHLGPANPPSGVFVIPYAPIVDTPGNVDVTAFVGSGAIEYYYTVSAVNADGDLSIESDPVVITNGTLGTNKNRITWDAVTGAVGYKVWGRSAVLADRILIANTALLTYDDNGTEDGTPEVDAYDLITYYYEVSAVDGNGGESLVSTVVTCQNVNTLDATHVNRVAWPAIDGISSYNVYGRTAVSGDRILLANSTQLANPTTYFYDDDGTEIGTAKPTENTTGGYMSLDLVPTVGATPSGVAYFVEYDPDPDDTSKPARSKDGYWRNYWTVPNSPSEVIGNFASALRGEPTVNYMPIGGSVANLANTVTMGTGTDTSKRIIANNVSSDPELRFNIGTGKWELSNDGSAFDVIAVQGDITGGGGGGGSITAVTAGTGLGGGGTSGSVTLFVRNITNTHISSAAAIAWSKLQSGTIPTSRIPYDNTSVVLNGSSQLSVNYNAGIPVGTIWMYAGATAPTGWMMCDGSMLDRTTYAALFAILGTNYGATTGSNFGIPDLRQRFPLGRAASGTGAALGATGGAIDHTHTGPSHTHTVDSHTHSVPAHGHGINSDGAHTHGYSSGNAFGVFVDVAAGGDFTVATPSHQHGGSTGSAGGHSHGGGTDNAGPFTSGATAPATDAAGTGATGAANPPFVVVNYVIKY